MKRLILIPLLFCAGCAGEQELRSVSAKSAVILGEYRDHLTEFARRQDALNDANQRRVTQLEAMRNERQAEIKTRRLAWELAGDAASVKRLDLISSTGTDDILAMGGILNPAPPPPTIDALKYDPTAVNAVISQLNDLREEVGLLQRAEELIAYGRAVRDAVKEDVAEASDDSAAAASETAEAAKNTAETTAKPATANQLN